MSNTKKATKKTNKTKTINAKEMKAWLRGVQEFQPAGWTPSAEQWATIRDRIFLLEEVESSELVNGPQSYSEQHHYQPELSYTAVKPSYVHVPQDSSLNVSSNVSGPLSSGKLATSQSPTESGVVPVTSGNEVLEGEYKSAFS